MNRKILTLLTLCILLFSTALAIEINSSRSLKYYGNGDSLDFRVGTDGVITAYGNLNMQDQHNISNFFDTQACTGNQFVTQIHANGSYQCSSASTADEDNQTLSEVLVQGNVANMSIDLGENALENVNSLQSNAGTDTIRFDGSNNVEIPNGAIDMYGHNIENVSDVYVTKEIKLNDSSAGNGGGGFRAGVTGSNRVWLSPINNGSAVFDREITYDPSVDTWEIENGLIVSGGNLSVDENVTIRGSAGLSLVNGDLDLGNNGLTSVGSTQCANDEFLDGNGECETVDSAGGGDEKVAVNSTSSSRYVGNDGSSGVLQVGGPVTYTLGNDFVTLGLQEDGDLVAGDALIGGAENVLPGSESDVTFQLDQNSVNESYLTTSVAGNGLTGGDDTPLSIANSGVDADQLAKNAVNTTHILDDVIMEADLNATNSASGGQVLTYDASGTGEFTWADDSSGTDDQDLSEVLVQGNVSNASIDMDQNNILDIGGLYAGNSPTGSFFDGSGGSDSERVSGINADGTLQYSSIAIGSGNINDGSIAAIDIGKGEVNTTHILNDVILAADLNATNSASGGQFLTYDASGTGEFTWVNNPDNTVADDQNLNETLVHGNVANRSIHMAGNSITGINGLTVIGGTVSLPNDQIDNSELATDAVSGSGGTGDNVIETGSIGSNEFVFASVNESHLASSVAGNGFTSGSADGTPLNIGQGTGISVNANDISIDSTVPQMTVDETLYGNWTFDHDLTVGGDLFVVGNISNTNVQELNVNGSILPPREFDGQFDLGSEPQEWQHLYLSGNLEIGSITLSETDLDALDDGVIDNSELANRAVGANQLRNGAVNGTHIGVSCSNDDVLHYSNGEWVCGSKTTDTNTDNQTLSEVLVQGDTANRSINMGGFPVENLGDPNSGDDAMDRDYADGRYVLEAGDTMGGDLLLGTNDLVNVQSIDFGSTDTNISTTATGSSTSALYIGDDRIVTESNDAVDDADADPSNEFQSLSEVLNNGTSAGSFNIDMNENAINNIGSPRTNITTDGTIDAGNDVNVDGHVNVSTGSVTSNTRMCIGDRCA